MVTVIDHPLITHKLTIMRNEETGHKDFRENLDEIASLMAYEVLRDLPLKDIHITTPMGPCDTKELATEVILVPILRAGMGLVNGIMDLIPTAKVGFIGLYRDEDGAVLGKGFGDLKACSGKSLEHRFGKIAPYAQDLAR